MIIGIDVSRAFLLKRTGIEEYSYQVVNHLMKKTDKHQVILYLRKNQKIDFELPKNWQTRTIKLKYFWTQVGLSLEMLWRPVDVLFVPAHTVPLIHPKNTFVTVHGLEYEFCPEAYSFWERLYMRFFIKKSCRWAKKIISVSENTKKDLKNLYQVPEEKIEVIYEGYDDCYFCLGVKNNVSTLDSRLSENDRYILFVGRLEERKNILGIIQTFEILKEKYKLSHRLVLAGRSGYGYEKIEVKIRNSKFREDILELGFVSEEEKRGLYERGDIFLFPSFYEGFGLPILEAQKAEIPVVASNVSSIPEVAGQGAILIDPKDCETMARKIFEIVSDNNLRNTLIQEGRNNLERFSWKKCVYQLAGLFEK